MAALLAPKSSTAPDIPFHNLRPRLSVTSAPSGSSPEESALGVLAQVAHEIERPVCNVTGNYFGESNLLPTDLAEALVQMYSFFVVF